MGSDRRQATAAVENVVDTIVRAVHKGDSVTITGFGVFEQRRRAARVARNPRTGETVKVKPTSVPAFRPGAQFKAVVSGAQRLPAEGPAVKRGVRLQAARKKAARRRPPRRPSAGEEGRARRPPAKKAAAKKAAGQEGRVAKKAAPAKKAAAKKAAPAKKTAAAKKAARPRRLRRQEGRCQEGCPAKKAAAKKAGQARLRPRRPPLSRGRRVVADLRSGRECAVDRADPRRVCVL